MAESKNGTAGAFGKIKGWFKGLKAEFKKIVWESRETVTKQTVAVVVISLILGLLIALIDFALQYGINFLTELGI